MSRSLLRWLLSFVGTAALAALVWFFGPLVPGLDGIIARAAIAGVLLLVWLIANLLIGRRRAKADDALVAGVAAGPSPTDTATAEETAAMGEKLTAALSLLKRARGTRGYLYEQPWYVIIGPPGAGKTTALLNAGLQFPLAAELGQGAVAGAGGTRMCDWWFTDQAVLIDTAGRYTTQDSDAEVDRAGWTAFLDLLRRTRQRQPINGLIVAIALADIATASAAERTAHARAIRKRIREVTDRLGVRVPVYALFTKADLIAGFTEFFDDLDRDRRAQVWGMTFPLASGDSGPVAGFGTEFRALVQRLDERLLERLQAERSPEKRALIAGFPAQVASLEQPLAGFLQEAFGGTKLDPAPFLRGAYLASGTQEGTPIDRLTGAMARAFGVDQRRARSLQPTQGRSYFLGRLLREVVFHEAMLVSARPGSGRRRMLLRAGAFAALLLVALGASALLLRARAQQQAEIDATAAALALYEQTAKPLPLDPVADADLPKIVPLLDQARALPHGFDSGEEPGGRLGLGLSQRGKLATASHAVYRHALERVLLPRLVWRLETQIRGSLNQPNLVYEATRVYLMLGNAGPLDRDLVRAWEVLTWGQLYPGAGAAPFRDDLARHLNALLADPLPAVPLDGGLVAEARATFSRVPLAERVYSRIRPVAERMGIAPWRPADAAGASGARVFLRASGKPLTDGIPGLYTVEGFHRAVLPSLPIAAKQVADESWVLGTASAIDAASPQMRSLESDVVKLYTDEYAQAWDAMLADLNVVPLRNLSQAVQDLYVLSSPQSPMRDVLTSMARQLTLSVPPPAPPGTAAAAGAVAAATAAGQAAETTAAARLQGVLGAAATAPPPPPPGRAIDDRYKALRDVVGSGPGAPIDGLLKLLNDLQSQLNRIASTPAGAAPAPMLATGDDPARLIVAESQRQPQPVARWLAAMATSGGALRGGGAKQQLDDALNAPGGPADLCAKAVTGRYPFVSGAANEIPMDDFARLFAAGGLLDTFFNTQARAFTDTSGATWRPQDVNGVAAPISGSNVAQFQRASKIRDLFFGAGGTAPTVRFDITPVSLDNTSTQVTFDFDGTVLQYAHGPLRGTSVTWPGPNRMTNVRLTFDPPPAGGAPIQASGPWALFRVVQTGTLQSQGSAERFTLTFKTADRSAVFDVRAGSVLNPFAPGVLSDFRCPSSR